LFKKVVLILALVFLVATGLAVDLNYWSLQAPYGTGATAKGSLSVYTNPAALILQRKWEANFLSTIWNDDYDSSYEVYMANLIQPLENGFAGALDIIYGHLKDEDEEDNYASFGYTVAGKMNDIGWGARIITGRFDKKDDQDAYYGSANFGLMYAFGENSYLMINANAPQIVTSDASLFEVNKPESFWFGGGLLSATDDARGYVSLQGYTKEKEPYLSSNFGGGVKIGILNVDLSLSVMDIGRELNEFSKVKPYGNSLVMLDFENFSAGLSVAVPLNGFVLSDLKYNFFVTARW